MSIARLMQMAAAGAGGATDPDFNQTVLLLHGDGTNGAQNNTFLDSSTNNFTITRNGNTTQGTFSPFSLPNGQWSNYFNSTTQQLRFADSTAFDLANDFTIEFWVYPTAVANNPYFVCLGDSAATNNGFLIYYSNATSSLRFYVNGAAVLIGSSLSNNQWYHVAVVRSGGGTNNLKMYLNGVQDAQATNTDSYTGVAGNGFAIGAEYNSGVFGGNGWFYMSNCRLVKGTAVYTGAFTPPTTPLTAITNTSLLTCQSNRFVDNSSNAFAITVNSNPSVQPFSPFLPSAAYDSSVNGGSGYFDGTGDYLSVPSNTAFAFGTGDFTVEGWVYYSSVAVNGMRILATASAVSNVLVAINNSNQLEFYDGSTTITFTGLTTQANAWNHIAVTRSGTSLRGYINGAQTGSTVTNSANIVNTQAVNFPATTNYTSASGYISSVRYLKGTALYTSSTYTIPTAPLTAISNTSFLCNFTNAGIFDNTGKNNLETVGNAQIDTTTKKYGTGSMEFDGTGDTLNAKNSDFYSILSGNYTIEFWIYPNDTTARGVMACVTSGTKNGWSLEYTTTPTIKFLLGDGSTINTTAESPTISASTWTHIACVKNGSTINVYANGIAGTSSTVSNVTAGTGPLIIGDAFNISGGNYVDGTNFNGFIDDLRITKGIARYTANFTPPSAAFPNF